MNHDPAVSNDLLNKQNKNTDKIDETARLFRPLAGDSLLGGPGDEEWRRKRKACSHAFYKERLKHMIENLKSTINVRVNQWKKEISESSDGVT